MNMGSRIQLMRKLEFAFDHNNNEIEVFLKEIFDEEDIWAKAAEDSAKQFGEDMFRLGRTQGRLDILLAIGLVACLIATIIRNCQ